MSLSVVALASVALAADNVTAPPQTGEWLPLASQGLEVAPGSALDFSALVPARPAGASGPLLLGADGKLHLGDSSDPRFNCAMLANGPNLSWTLPTHQEADALAVQLRRHGYNLVRFHFMDGRLRKGASSGQSFNPENLDRYQYLLAALKRNGIYWMLDILTSPDGDRTQDYAAANSANNLKNRVNFDPSARASWARMLRDVYAQPNPYTGIAPLADPALAFVVGANENSITFWSRLTKDGPYPADLPKLFDQWLHKRFDNAAALATAIPDLTSDERSGKASIAPPAGWNATGARMTFFRMFISDLEVGTYRWMTDALRKEGYRGPVIGYPEWYDGLDNRTRGALPITDLHAYIGEVSSYGKGAPLKLTSMTLDEGLNNWLTNAGGRWLDRPLLFSEYGSPFPNPNRRDSGLLFPAVSAFQGYSALCRMASMSIEPAIPAPAPGTKAIYPYSVGLDPIARVAETLSTMLFYRRDISEAAGPGVAVPFGKGEMANGGSAFLPVPVKRAALLVKFGLIAPEKVDALPTGTQIMPLSAPPQGMMDKAMDRLISIATGDIAQRSKSLISALFARGLLPKGNRTSIDDGIYQSQTGETLIDQRRGLITISTARTEAINLMAPDQAIALRNLSLLSLNEGALVAATALDGKPLERSDRILFILAGDARNTDMAMAGDGARRTLIDWGKLPILLQRVVAKISFRQANPFNGHFSVLALNGQPLSTRPVSSENGGAIPLTLDTAAVRAAPTTYFLLERSNIGSARASNSKRTSAAL